MCLVQTCWHVQPKGHILIAVRDVKLPVAGCRWPDACLSSGWGESCNSMQVCWIIHIANRLHQRITCRIRIDLIHATGRCYKYSARDNNERAALLDAWLGRIAERYNLGIQIFSTMKFYAGTSPLAFLSIRPHWHVWAPRKGPFPTTVHLICAAQPGVSHTRPAYIWIK